MLMCFNKNKFFFVFYLCNVLDKDFLVLEIFEYFGIKG